MTEHRFPALGFDPAPGSCDAIASLARDCGSLGVDMLEDSDRLRRIADGSAWRGAAADAFRHRLEHLPRDLDRAGDAYQQACTALSRFSLALAEAQVTARALEHRAASMDLHDRDQITVEAGRLRDQVRADAAACGRALHDATRHAPQPPGWFHRLVDAGVHAMSAVNNAVGDFVRAHAGVIAAFADALSKVSSALAVVVVIAGPIPVLGQAVGSLAAGGALLTAGMALVGHTALAAYAGGSWTAVVLDGAAVVTGLGPRGVEAAAGRVAAARGIELGETSMRAPEALAVLRHPRAGLAAMSTATMTFPELVTRTVSHQFDLAAAGLGTVDLARSGQLPSEVREAAARGREEQDALDAEAGDPRQVEVVLCRD